MLYPMTPAQKEYVALANGLAVKFAARAAEHDATGDFPLANYDDARAAGLPSLVIPTEFGGWGAGLLDSLMTVEALATGDGSTALCLTMHFQTMGSASESRSWSPPLFERICHEAVKRGALINSIATEPELGSPSRGGLPKTTADPEYAAGQSSGTPAYWVVNGLKSWATMIPALDYMIIPAALQDGSGEVARFIISTQAPDGGELEILNNFNAMGMRCTASHDIRLKNMRVPHGNITGRSAGEAARGPGVNAWFMLLISATYVGVGLAAHRAAIRYAQERIPTALGRPIATVEGIQRRLGEAELLLRQARVQLYQAADMWDRFPERRSDMVATIATAKFTATNNAIQAVDHCMRVAGGASMMKTLPLERYYRDVRGGLNHPINDDMALVTLGKMAIAALGEE